MIEFLLCGFCHVCDEVGQICGTLEFDFAVGGFCGPEAILREVGFEDVGHGGFRRSWVRWRGKHVNRACALQEDAT